VDPGSRLVWPHRMLENIRRSGQGVLSQNHVVSVTTLVRMSLEVEDDCELLSIPRRAGLFRHVPVGMHLRPQHKDHRAILLRIRLMDAPHRIVEHLTLRHDPMERLP